MKQKKQKKGSTIIMIIKIQSVVPTSITIFIAIIFLFSHSIVTPLSFAQSDMTNSTNQTMKNMSQSAIKQSNICNKMLIKLARRFRETLVMMSLTSLKKQKTLEKI
jgi:flagellar basal body-associated protein FliL